MKRTLIVIFIVIVAAVLTRPKEQQHQEKINSEFKKHNPVGGALGGGKLFSGLLEYHDNYVYSYTTFRGDMVSLGLFKTVFVPKDLDINLNQE